MKRWIFLVVSGFILCVGQMVNAAPVLESAGVWFLSNYYDQQYFSSDPGNYYMYSHVIMTDDGQSPTFDPYATQVTVTSSMTGTYTIDYMPSWYYGNLEPYLFGKVLQSSPPSFVPWETSYTFNVYNTGEPSSILSTSLTINPGTYKYLGAPVATYDTATKIISWNPVPGVDKYAVRFFDEYHQLSLCYFSSDMLPPSQTSYLIPWDQFEPGNYWIRVEASDLDDINGTLINRSTYSTMASNPVPIPGAVWLLGSGLLGLLGIRRRRKRRHV